MKVVINSCYGGFSLSPQAVKRMAELQGKPYYFFKLHINADRHTPVEISSLMPRDHWAAFTIPNPDEVIGRARGIWHEMSAEQRREYNAGDGAYRLEKRPENRCDPVLIKVVEELGEAANGHAAQLKIVEIPDDVKWELQEHRGMETIHEVHRVWS